MGTERPGAGQHIGKGWEGGQVRTLPRAALTAPLWPAVSVSINNLYPGCENVSVRSRSMMFEPGLTKGMLEVFVAPSHHSHCSADDQSTKAIDIQNAYLNGMSCPLPEGRPSSVLLPVLKPGTEACPGGHPSQPTKHRGRASAVILGLTQD